MSPPTLRRLIMADEHAAWLQKLHEHFAKKPLKPKVAVPPAPGTYPTMAGVLGKQMTPKQ
jgi:hypothetical protein